MIIVGWLSGEMRYGILGKLDVNYAIAISQNFYRYSHRYSQNGY
ncbi:hypothetical protein COO91_05133 [Nostoc flagelliforme CCNUN1]|uniref:Uncharacterized protein n=1 Tax=Nostoc flagelliforme CCNUN1 TaxID=2038116 RepID=A0A2K8SUM0_9NOSO|nr:hypothetical protein COO91_05133 [Nostoc flagelliforme CCNUN1]